MYQDINYNLLTKKITTMTLQEKLQLRKAKLSWRQHMRNLYPNFKKRMWATNSYRLAYPQSNTK
jgi:hypothetical protein